MISDLNSLVNEAKSAANNSSTSLNHDQSLSSLTSNNTSRSNNTSSRGRNNSSRGRGGGGRRGDIDDDEASLSSFSRNIARVAQQKDSASSVRSSTSRSGAATSLRSNPPPPPAASSPRTKTPPRNPNPYANTNNNNSMNSIRSTNKDDSMMSINSRASHRSSSSRMSGGSFNNSANSFNNSGNGSRMSNNSRRSGGSGGGASATERLMTLVNELSTPKPLAPSHNTSPNNNNSPRGRAEPSPGGMRQQDPRERGNDPSVASNPSGYLPNQYNNGDQGRGERARGGDNFSVASSQARSQGSSRRGDSVSNSRGGNTRASNSNRGGGQHNESLEPTGFIMPPGSVNGGESTGSYTNNGSQQQQQQAPLSVQSMYSNQTGGGSMMSSTSAGQSTMPTEYQGSWNNDNNMAGVGGGMGMTYSMEMAPPALMNVPANPSGSAAGGGNSQYSVDSFSNQQQLQLDARSAPGGSMNSGALINHSNFLNTDDPSQVSRSYMSQPPNNGGVGFMSPLQQQGMLMGASNMGDSYISGANSGSSMPMGGGSQYQQDPNMLMYGSQQGGGYIDPNNNMSQYGGYGGMQPGQMIQQEGMYSSSGASSFGGSKGSRSLANSAAIIPQAKFSWASESVGTQSTVLTRRSFNTASVPEPQHEKEGNKVVAGRLWASFAWIITFPVPNKCIMRPTKDAKQAWREKVALFVIMVSCSVFFVGVFGFVPLLLCKEDSVFSMADIWTQTGEEWVVVHGTIYDVKTLINRHPGGVKGIVDFLGKDGSKVFPRAPPVTLPQKCLDMEKVRGFNLDVYTPENNFTNPACQSFSELDILLGMTCHTFAAGSNGTAKFLGDYERGILSHTTVGLNAEGISWFSLYDRVYDVTNYVKAINENREPVVDEEDETLDNNPAAYLTSTLNKVIMNSLGGDATDLYEALFGSSEYIACLEEMFYTGLLDDEFDTFCYTLNIMMYVMLIFVASLMVIQFIASMVYICPRHRTYSEEDVMSPVMIMVPCYNEGDNELRKTIKSVLNTLYPDENKVLLMVADGLVTGNGEDMSTPEHLANILGFDIDEFEDDTFEYDCIGVIHTKNRARVYHGILQKGHKFLKYIAVVKCGLPEEAATSAKPGNRGKRDSQLIIMGYYNRIHYGRELTELDSAIQRAMVDLNLQADMVRFLMAIDADTRVDTMSITHMVYGMDKKEKVLALCGETKVDNKASSWVTMIQVFEYYNSHHLKKAFEAAFGCVTCLPGCFTMYRIIADDGTPLLPGDGVLYEYSRNDIETLHEKNLYHLGEDRMLTTLLLKYYPDRSLTFIPEATCWTIVPHTFRILLSQRRRWINSTVHNMFELLKVNTMCGVCCVSMKVVVFIDLLATMILPASYIYAMYLLFLVFFEDLPVSTILLILYGIIMGVQIVVFILRSRWEYLWWFLIYFVVGLPVFYLILPTYSFWNMDDFSWGKTRSVGGSAAENNAANMEDDEDDDDEYDDVQSGYGNLNEEDTNAPSAVDSDDSSNSSGEEESSDEDEDEIYEGSEYSSRNDGDQFHESDQSEYFSRASQMQNNSTYR